MPQTSSPNPPHILLEDAASLWLATYKEYGMLMRLAEAAGATVEGVKGAARRMRA